ncbi:MAG: signal peptidase I [Nocardioidaceae bacterium]
MALLGAVALLAVVAGWLFQVTPLVFRSGSMGPDINTGALGLARQVPASDLRVGDVVSVTAADGVRITHRVTRIADAPERGEVSLTLKGDANEVPDAAPYVVSSADRVFAHVDGVGYVVAWLSSPAAMFAGGLVAAWLLLTVFRGRRGESTKPTVPIEVPATLAVAVVALAAVVGLGGSRIAGTSAAFTDAATARSGTFTATTTGWDTGSTEGQGGIYPGNTSTSLPSTAFTWTVNNPASFCVTVRPETSSATSVQWRLKIDTTELPWNGKAPENITGAVVDSSPDASGVMYLEGTDASWLSSFDETQENATIVAGQRPLVTLCVYNGGLPSVVASGSGTYTYTTVLSSGAQDSYACAETTITGYYPTFYVGWQIQVDWKAVLAQGVADGEITSAVQTALQSQSLEAWYGSSGSYSVSDNGSGVYTARGATPSSSGGITNGQTLTVEACTS